MSFPRHFPFKASPSVYPELRLILAPATYFLDLRDSPTGRSIDLFPFLSLVGVVRLAHTFRLPVF